MKTCSCELNQNRSAVRYPTDQTRIHFSKNPRPFPLFLNLSRSFDWMTAIKTDVCFLDLSSTQLIRFSSYPLAQGTVSRPVSKFYPFLFFMKPGYASMSRNFIPEFIEVFCSIQLRIFRNTLCIHNLLVCFLVEEHFRNHTKTSPGEFQSSFLCCIYPFT